MSAETKAVFARVSVVKDHFVLQLYGRVPKKGTPFKNLVIPDSLVESLKNVEQGVDVKLTTGFSPQEIVDSKKSVVELVTMKGVKVEVEVSFLRSLHKTLQEAFKGEENAFTEGLAMAGPAFALNTKFKSELTFKDFSELSDHPMASSFVLTLSQILEEVVDADLQTLKDKKLDISALDQDKLQALVDKGELPAWRIDELKTLSAIVALTDEVDPVTKADACLCFGGLASLEGEVRGHGFAELIGTILKAVTLRDRERNYERIHKTYLKEYDMAKYLELYGEEEKEEAQGEEGPAEGEEKPASDAPPAEAPAASGEELASFKDESPEAGDAGGHQRRAPQYDEAKPLIQAEEAAPVQSRDNQPRKVKSTTKQAPVQEEVYGDTEQMKQIKAYIQEQVQLRVNAAIDQEAERQIELQMREFKEQYLREAAQRIPQQNGGSQNRNGAQVGRIPANIIMGRQSLKKETQPAGEKSERATRASRKDRAAAQVPSNTARRAESQAKNKELRGADQLQKKATSPNTYKK